MHPGGQYRRDIDGLRALAILPVLLYHVHVPGLGGGYVGVDVFFVISGYLITGIIAREIDAGRFSLKRFYERRARRILPALFAVVAAVLVLSAWLYLPGDFAGVPPSALMALGFLANVWFFSNTGYFAGGAETMPLLHTWSLGVEEQFYIGFPLLLWLIARYLPQRRVLVVAGLAALSFAWALLKSHDTDGFAFYMLPPRAWELFAGALLALGAVPEVRRGWLRQGLALAGAAMVLGAVLLYDKQTVFPGLTALPPVLGTVLLIHCAPGTLVGRVLSLRGPVAVGLISYSLYLWHWPVIVFAEYARGQPLAGLGQALAVAVSLVLAWLSWRFIERPFRDTARFDQRRIFVWSGAAMAALGIAAAALLPLGGWPSRFPPEVARLAAAKADFSPARDACLSEEIGGERPDCTLGAKANPTALVWGDSHGVELAWVLGEVYAKRGEGVIQRTRGSCPPVLGYAVANDPGCARFNAATIAEIEASPVTRVYLAAFWANGVIGADPATVTRLDATIARLRRAGKAVTLIGPVPPQPFDVPRALAMAAAQGRTVAGSTAADYARGAGWLQQHYPRWQAQGVTVLDPARVLVAGGRTRIEAGGVPLYFDSHHLSLAGARAVVASETRP